MIISTMSSGKRRYARETNRTSCGRRKSVAEPTEMMTDIMVVKQVVAFGIKSKEIILKDQVTTRRTQATEATRRRIRIASGP